ncbi:uncharacterized protein LOC123530274 [Mercenaria mercenaria]|uniref:uncharacterized protein LOC123530274 n=1 Tax=Mercenaria mercenaria TaxID=6596 RepID=UPI00234F880E|nr:uncharacterized protein LOC123530274 [Mercenaria mercenaria]
MHLNIQSLKPKIDLLTVEAEPYDILVFSETWLSSNVPDEDLYIQNFKPPFRCDRRDRGGGGVAIHVRDTIHAVERKDLHMNNLEALWIEIHVNQRKLLIAGIYRPPDSNNTQWLNMEHSLDQAFNGHFDDILVTGDFNVNILASPSSRMSRLIDSYNAKQLISTPTYFTEHSSSFLDLMFVKNPCHILSSFVADPFIPDLSHFHCPIVTVFKFHKPKQLTYKRHIWLYDKGDYPTYRNNLNTTDWNSILDCDNLHETADKIADAVLSAAADSIPNKSITVRPDDVPWINKGIRMMIRKRNRAHQQAKTSNNERAWANFRKIRNDTTNLIRKTKKEYTEKLIEEINSENTNVKKWYKLAKKFSIKKSPPIPTLIDNGSEVSLDKDKAELLNTFFCNQSTLD